MKSLERPESGGQERDDQNVLNQFSLENLAKLAPEETGPRISEKRRGEMTARLNELNQEIPKIAEELNIIEHAMGAVDVPEDKTMDGAIVAMSANAAGIAEPEVDLPKLSQEEFEKLRETRADLLQKIQALEYERHTMESVLFPDDYQELERNRRELGIAKPGLNRYFRHPGRTVAAHPAAPEKPASALAVPPKKTGLIAKLKGLFGG